MSCISSDALADASSSQTAATLADAPCSSQPVAALCDIPWQSPLDAHPEVSDYIQRQANAGRGTGVTWRRILHHLFKSRKKAGGRHVVDGFLKDLLETSDLLHRLLDVFLAEEQTVTEPLIAKFNSFDYDDGGAACGATTAVGFNEESATETVCKEVVITLFVSDAINNDSNSKLALSQKNWHTPLAELLQETRRLLRRDSIADGPTSPVGADGQPVAPGLLVGAVAQPAPTPMPLLPMSDEKTKARLLEPGSMLRSLQAHSDEFGYDDRGSGPDKLHSFWLQATSQRQPVAPPAQQPPSGSPGSSAQPPSGQRGSGRRQQSSGYDFPPSLYSARWAPAVAPGEQPVAPAEQAVPS